MSTLSFETIQDFFVKEQDIVKRTLIIAVGVVVTCVLLRGLVYAVLMVTHANHDLVSLTELSILEVRKDAAASSSIATSTVVYVLRNRAETDQRYTVIGTLMTEGTTAVLFEEYEYLEAQEQRLYEQSFTGPLVSTSTLRITLENEGQTVYQRLSTPP